jgi:hypothetical protein
VILPNPIAANAVGLALYAVRVFEEPGNSK